MTEETNQTETIQKESILDKAQRQADELKELTALATKETDRWRVERAKNMLGGTTPSGGENNKKEETPQEYMKRVMSGGLNDNWKHNNNTEWINQTG